ncbi:DUF1641 domain-containing protein [Desertibacillus haloalkaliphilus]|uniref:DUF1641 domain-containing protein n=1 Tax=Desertibacillus haloalkaliphilus TaxID=1328930 RepID=UPI001C27E874|nr:DUF1641 domain-containing protein [Desertibacillus haloalkaliphilus]MBU8908680.1 DUF1641 domain-containing protein [Desertibacillus haloalkaliphilus]
MAKQITQIEKQTPSEVEERAEAIKKLVDMTADNHESLMTFMEIIEELHEAGILDMVKGLLRTRDKVGALAVEQMNQPTMHRVIRNGTSAFQFLGRMDPDQLEQMLNGVSQGLDKTADRTGRQEPIGLWGMVKQMRDPDVNASMTTLLGFLQGMGQEFNKKTAQ